MHPLLVFKILCKVPGDHKLNPVGPMLVHKSITQMCLLMTFNASWLVFEVSSGRLFYPQLPRSGDSPQVKHDGDGRPAYPRTRRRDDEPGQGGQQFRDERCSA
jgi:hypothetical protein